MAKKTPPKARWKVSRSPSCKQVIVDHIFSGEEDGTLRLLIGTDSLTGTHDDVKTEVIMEVELLFHQAAVENLEKHLTRWRKRQMKHEGVPK